MDKDIILPDELKDNNIAKELSIMPKVLDEYNHKLLDIESKINELKLVIELQEDKIKKNTYFDEKLTNKEKRDITYKELLSSNTGVIELKQKLTKLLDEKNLIEIDMKFLYNKFVSLRLLVRLYKITEVEE